jgi:hypothetical protein
MTATYDKMQIIGLAFNQGPSANGIILRKQPNLPKIDDQKCCSRNYTKCSNVTKEIYSKWGCEKGLKPRKLNKKFCFHKKHIFSRGIFHIRNDLRALKGRLLCAAVLSPDAVSARHCKKCRTALQVPDSTAGVGQRCRCRTATSNSFNTRAQRES